MRRLILLPGAFDEIRAASCWYEGQRGGLGAQFERALDTAFDRLLTDPFRFPVVAQGGLRRLIVQRFPYHLYFKADENTVRIIVVFHTSRSPRALLARLKGH